MTSLPKNELSHVDEDGRARMVNVSKKTATHRTAVAEAWVLVGPDIAAHLQRHCGIEKGPVLSTAEIAGVMGAKQTAQLIPMCHPLLLNAIQVQAELQNDQIRIVAEVTSDGKTGVEMEAMTAAAVAALTVYDMVKSAGKGIEIGPIRLLEKRGGKSGQWIRKGDSHGTD
jgi:cyclic pyranopterin phosphate synthase